MGKEILTIWIAEPSEPMAVREELLVKVLASHLVAPEVIIDELKRRQEMHQEKLAACLEKEREMLQEPSLDKYTYLTLRRGIRYESEWVEWCKEAIEAMSS